MNTGLMQGKLLPHSFDGHSGLLFSVRLDHAPDVPQPVPITPPYIPPEVPTELPPATDHPPVPSEQPPMEEPPPQPGKIIVGYA